jgi:hypothetical protein
VGGRADPASTTSSSSSTASGGGDLTRRYKARFLSLKHHGLCASQLNGEAVRGLWSSMMMELLFAANDDDERYSIQVSAGIYSVHYSMYTL